MLLIEADGKALLRTCGIPVPDGVVVDAASPQPALVGDGPWVVKAQVPVGGRAKAGGVLWCRTRAEAADATRRMLGQTIRGHVVRACLIEEAVTGTEAYLSLMLDPQAGAVRVALSERGGIDIETAAQEGALASTLCDAEGAAVTAGIERLAATMPAHISAVLRPIAERAARLFFESELLLVEINPLFIGPGGTFAGDAKIVIDGNSLHRQPMLQRFIDARPVIYRDAWRKLHEGFDFIDLDDEGTIGLITTGAGLSMMLIDELVARGGAPANFCDIRTGQLRGSPERLMRVMEWLSAKARLKVVFVNVFAGITDLAEFARLLVQALDRCPALTVPVIARLVGNGERAARDYLAVARPDLAVYSDMEPALDHVVAVARA
jgi:succinyl-CoA synthetase beta subunit